MSKYYSLLKVESKNSTITKGDIFIKPVKSPNATSAGLKLLSMIHRRLELEGDVHATLFIRETQSGDTWKVPVQRVKLDPPLIKIINGKQVHVRYQNSTNGHIRKL